MSIMYLWVLLLFTLDGLSDVTGCTSRSEIKVFPIQCEGTAIGNFCAGKLGEPSTPTSFKAIPERQEVVEDDGHGNLHRLDGCVVKDWDTWQCYVDWHSVENEDGSSGRESVTQTMDRGSYTMSVASVGPADPSNTVYVPGWRWWWQNLTWKPEPESR